MENDKDLTTFLKILAALLLTVFKEFVSGVCGGVRWHGLLHCWNSTVRTAVNAASRYQRLGEHPGLRPLAKKPRSGKASYI